MSLAHFMCMTGKEVLRIFRKFDLYRLISDNQPAIISYIQSSSALNRCFMFMYAFLLGLLMVPGDTLIHPKASLISSTWRTETPARYISTRASSTEDSLRRNVQ